MIDPQSKLRDKISKLMNMTVENGCTEDEQETAMSMAAGFAARAGIELDSCRPAGAPKTVIKSKRNNLSFKMHQYLAARAAAVLYGAELYASDFGKNGVEFTGREDNVELAEQTMFWLMRQVELLYKQNLPRGLSQQVRAQYRRTFKEACALRVFNRAEQLMRQMRTDDRAAQAAVGGTALIVAHHFDVLKDEIRDYWDEKYKIGKYASEETQKRVALAKTEAEQLEADYLSGKKKRPKVKQYKMRTRTIRSGIGTAAGQAAADRVQLRKEIK